MEKHLSSLELDVYRASTARERESADGQAISGHVETCELCRGYLDHLDALALEPPLLQARLAARMSIAPRATRSSKVLRRMGSAAAVFALAAGLVVYLGSRIPAEDDAAYVGVKGGAPAAQVLVRRDGRVRVWDGVSLLRAGDAIAVSVACERFARVTIASFAGSGPSRAWEGACPGTPNTLTLPFTLVVDRAPGGERFSVVFSREPLDDGHLASAIRATSHDETAWTIHFVFAKEN